MRVSQTGRNLGAAAALLAVLALAAGATGGLGHDIGSAGKPAAASLAFLMAIAIGAGLVLFVFFLRWVLPLAGIEDDPREGPPLELSWWRKLGAAVAPALVFFALALAVIAVVSSVQNRNQSSPSGGAAGAAPGQVGGNQGSGSGVPLIALGVAALLAAGGVGFALFARRGHAEPGPPSESTELQVAAASALAAIEIPADPRRGVIAAYAAMERELARRGMPRHLPEAPLEFAGRAGSSFPAAPLRRLAELFELARFSLHPVGERMRREAVSLLSELREAP